MDILVALGGGGTRGAAHIGVLRVLEKSGFRVRGIAGTSIGSIVASLFALGKTPDELEEIFRKVDQSKLFGWPLSDGPGLLGVKAINDFLKSYLAETQFSELSLPCSVVAVDLKSNREIILNSGPVIDAIMGSIAVPVLFPPKDLGEYRLIDGGVLDPVPVRAARVINSRLPVIAVSLSQPLDGPAAGVGSNGWTEINPLAKQISRMNITQAFRVFSDSVELVSRQMAELRLKIDKPDVIIRPDLVGISLLDRIDVLEVIERGENAATAALPEIFTSTTFKAKLAKQFQNLFRME